MSICRVGALYGVPRARSRAWHTKRTQERLFVGGVSCQSSVSQAVSPGAHSARRVTACVVRVCASSLAWPTCVKLGCACERANASERSSARKRRGAGADVTCCSLEGAAEQRACLLSTCTALHRRLSTVRCAPCATVLHRWRRGATRPYRACPGAAPGARCCAPAGVRPRGARHMTTRRGRTAQIWTAAFAWWAMRAPLRFSARVSGGLRSCC